MFSVLSKILIVDDMMTIRKIAKKVLSEMNYKNIFEAADGNEAWQLMNTEGDFDIVISDWNMPKMTGLELLHKVRAHEKFKNTPFVLLTAEADSSQVKQALESGVDNYILKPFSADSLKAKLEQTYQKVNKRSAA